ncbi:MAG: DUF1990 domain-containing protein [Verrucomicrobiota bacterium]
MIRIQRPETADIAARLASWHDEPLSYAHPDGVESPPEEKFIVEEHRVCLGQGREVFEDACQALDGWKMFPKWAEVSRERDRGQVPGDIVAMVVSIFGLWWINPCRVLRRVDASHAHGFVYGTLPEHSECGEEMFAVEMDEDGRVWYVIRAFSRPQHWLAWMGFPLARWWQCRFVRDSQQRMREVCGTC